MENAGSAMAKVIRRHYPPSRTLILCGPGANGGDGFVVARHLREDGWQVEVLGSHVPQEGTDAHLMAAKVKWNLIRGELAISPQIELIVDGIFGAGLSRPLEGRMAQWVAAVNAAGKPVVSADLPSGLPGDLQFTDGPVIRASHTVTFEVKKPAHLLGNALDLCGNVHVVPIGIPDAVLNSLTTKASENSPQLWPGIPTEPAIAANKHNRGRMLVVTGGALQTGAARLAARAGLRMGAGWVSLFGSKAAMRICAAHETSLVLHARKKNLSLGEFLGEFLAQSVVLGPAGGVGKSMRTDVTDLCNRKIPCVLDADALTSFADAPDQ